jgi:hypothetical protein
MDWKDNKREWRFALLHNSSAKDKVRCVSYTRSISEILGVALTLRLLMSYIYMEHLFLMFLDHTQRRSTVGGTPLDE